MDRARGATILLVEDNPDHAVFALKALRTDDVSAQVVWARDGQEALDYLERGHRGADSVPEPRPELILLDIHLPKVNGHEVLHRLKGDETLRTIPVVMLTTSDRAEDVNRAYRAGANSYVTKPVSCDEFRERLRSLKAYWLCTNALPAAQLTRSCT